MPMFITPEIHIQNAQLVTRSSSGDVDIFHEMTPQEAVKKFADEGASMLQASTEDLLELVDLDVAASNENLDR